MKLSTKQAAFLYLLLFNLGELGDQKFDLLEIRALKLLLDSQYPWKDIIYDNEGGPMIEWPEDFDWTEWVTNYLEPHDWVHPDLKTLLDHPTDYDLEVYIQKIKL